MTVIDMDPRQGAWLPLPAAAAAAGVSTDTMRRRIKAGRVPSRMDGSRYLVLVTGAKNGPTALQRNDLVVVGETGGDVKLFLEYLGERERARDAEIKRLQDELLQARVELELHRAALTPGKAWSLFDWVRQKWAAQMRQERAA